MKVGRGLGLTILHYFQSTSWTKGSEALIITILDFMECCGSERKRLKTEIQHSGRV